MGISVLTAIIIQTNLRKDIIVKAIRRGNNKYEGWIMFDEGNYIRPLLNTKAIYKNEKEAIKDQNKIIDKIRKIDITKEFKEHK